MQLSHDPAVIDAVFDEANLVSCAGLAPVMALAEQAGLSESAVRAVERCRRRTPRQRSAAWSRAWWPGRTRSRTWTCCGTARWIGCSPECGRRPRLGTFLRAFRFGHVRQLDAVAARLLARLAARAPLLPGAGEVAYVDIDDTVRATHGYAQAGRRVRLLGCERLERPARDRLDTAGGARSIAAARLRKGSTNSARGASRLVNDTLKTAAAAGADPKAGSLVIARMDSAFYNHDVIGAVRRGGAHFSVTARMGPTVRAAIAEHPRAGVDGDPLPERVRR